MSDPDICRRCAETGPTCCRLQPGGEEALFPISEQERHRIQEALPDAGGFRQLPNSAAFLDNMARLFPQEKDLLPVLFHPRKRHFSLATDHTGACRFLTSTGCAIPVQSRPYYCRLFPFWFLGGRLTAFEHPDCLACREARTVNRMMRIFGLSDPATLRDLHGRLRIAWGFPPKEGMEFVNKGL